MVTEAVVFKSISEIVKQQFEIPFITYNDSIQDDLGLDSLDCIDLLSAMESMYGIIIENDNEKEERKFYKVCEGTVYDLVSFFTEVINGKIDSRDV